MLNDTPDNRRDRGCLVNTDEAPKGYYAVASPRDPYKPETNKCSKCDWKKQCNDPNTVFTNPNHRCMSYGVVTSKGVEICREDRISVIFKQKPK